MNVTLYIFRSNFLRWTFLGLWILCGNSLNTYAQDIEVTQLKIGKKTENVFANCYADGRLYFCSDKKNARDKHEVNEFGQSFLDIYAVSMSPEGKIEGITEPLDSNVNTLLNEGPIFVHAQSKKAYFSSNLDDSVATEQKLKLFSTSYEKNQFSDRSLIKELDFGGNQAHPTLSADGKMMIFSSDMDGSQGASDLFYSFWEDGEWTLPMPIKVANSMYTETFPRIFENTLYFASNRTGGLGGLDIYSCAFSNGNFTEPVLMKAPINSEFDDFLYFPITYTQGFFSSNRIGGFDKIFRYESNLPSPTEFIEVQDNLCYEFSDDPPLPEAQYEYLWSFGDGTTEKGSEVKHCFADIGTYKISCDLIEKSTAKKEEGIMEHSLVIDIHTPVIVVEKSKDAAYMVHANMQWADSTLNKFYWIINGKMYFSERVELNTTISTSLSIKLVYWEENNPKNIVGVTKNLTLKQ